MSGFDDAFKAVVGHEGGLSLVREDRGNWTGGRVGVGELKGTKYGVSAMTYPKEDIRNLTLARAKAIYLRDFWKPLKGDALPYPIAFQLFDGAVNSGIGNAVRWLQAAAGVAQDGDFGPITLAAVLEADAEGLMARYNGHRLGFMADLSTWPTFGRGWARRIAANLIAVPVSRDKTDKPPAPVSEPVEPPSLAAQVADHETRLKALEAAQEG